MLPPVTARLRFREMSEGDLDSMAGLLGDPVVMRFYPRPKVRAEALDWIHWNQRNCAQYGFGLWVVERHDETFVGDCGLTWQTVEGEQHLEVGYHVVPTWQGLGYATEAATACTEFAATEIGVTHVIAIINPANGPSRRVAEKVGMTLEREAQAHGSRVVIYGRSDR